MTVSAMPYLEELMIIVMSQLTTGSKLNKALTTRQAYYISPLLPSKEASVHRMELTALSQQHAAATMS